MVRLLAALVWIVACRRPVPVQRPPRRPHPNRARRRSILRRPRALPWLRRQPPLRPGLPDCRRRSQATSAPCAQQLFLAWRGSAYGDGNTLDWELSRCHGTGATSQSGSLRGPMEGLAGCRGHGFRPTRLDEGIISPVPLQRETVGGSKTLAMAHLRGSTPPPPGQASCLTVQPA